MEISRIHAAIGIVTEGLKVIGDVPEQDRNQSHCYDRPRSPNSAIAPEWT